MQQRSIPFETFPEISRPPPLEIHTTSRGPWTVVSLVGELDLSTVPAVRGALEMAVASSASVAVDVSGLAFVDAAGLGTLVAMRNLAWEEYGTVVLVRPSPSVARILDLTGLASLVATEEPDVAVWPVEDREIAMHAAVRA